MIPSHLVFATEQISFGLFHKRVFFLQYAKNESKFSLHEF